jgi:hypothetical protein
MSFTRGVLLAGKFLTQHELNKLPANDQRNTLIFELATRTKENGSRLQGMDDDTLAGVGALFVFMREAGNRTDQELKTMTADDLRNTVIVGVGAQTGLSGPVLQGMKNIDLVLLALGREVPNSLTPGTYLGGVLMAGGFATHVQLLKMTTDQQRNTLIFQLATHAREDGRKLQGLNDFDLAGAGALFVLLRNGKIRTDAELKAMTVDDQRNVLIVEVGAQTGLGSQLQGLRNMDLVRIALGQDPTALFKPLPPPLSSPPREPYVFNISSFEMKTHKSDGDHSDSDWLSIVVTILDPVTKNVRALPLKTIQIGGSIKTGDIMRGTFASDPIDANDGEAVMVTLVLTNLGSSDAEEQFAQAVKVGDKVVGVVAPIAGAVIGFIFGGDPGEGFKVGQEVAKGVDTAISTLSDIFDFLHVHVGPPNCNGIVFQDTIVYQPNELLNARNKPASKEYTGTQDNERCGDAPVTRMNFSLL